MTNQTRRTTGILRAVARPSTAVAAAAVLAAGLALGACSKDVSASGGAPAAAGVAAQADASGSDTSTLDLVDAALTTPAVDTVGTASDAAPDAVLGAGDHRGLRARLLRALHGTWVTEGKNGPVTHQAIRGEVTAVSGTSVTVKARDGASMTFTVTADTRVRARANGKGADSSMSALHVGDKAFVAGVGATNPQARVVVFRSGTSATPARPATPAPSTTS